MLRRRPRLALSAGAVVGLSLAAVVALGARHAPVSGPAGPPAGEPRPSEAAEPPQPPRPSEPARAAAAAAPPGTDPAGPPGIRVEELRATSGSSCRRVAFGADPPERRPVPVEAGERLVPTRLAPDLCGLAVRATGMRVTVGPELRAAALPPVRLADGADAYFLREGARQNLVYAVQALPEAGADAGTPGSRLVHALTR